MKNYLGFKFRNFTCTKCKIKYSDFGFNRDRICPKCLQPELQDNNLCQCYSCQAGRYMIQSMEGKEHV